eukprot:TRINITY_DN1501_c0_g1_i1.p1 TRINITY_DN1501_c0_g1~~TRINITY_DN1501_c0_g1_i1.p1  ORF type:complete len:403 (+),score=73.34 TRINITY_DN1501_c0_g1_i1:121-1209(+)
MAPPAMAPPAMAPPTMAPPNVPELVPPPAPPTKDAALHLPDFLTRGLDEVSERSTASGGPSEPPTSPEERRQGLGASPCFKPPSLLTGLSGDVEPLPSPLSRISLLSALDPEAAQMRAPRYPAPLVPAPALAGTAPMLPPMLPPPHSSPAALPWGLPDEASAGAIAAAAAAVAAAALSLPSTPQAAVCPPGGFSLAAALAAPAPCAPPPATPPLPASPAARQPPPVAPPALDPSDAAQPPPPPSLPPSGAGLVALERALSSSSTPFSPLVTPKAPQGLLATGLGLCDASPPGVPQPAKVLLAHSIVDARSSTEHLDRKLPAKVRPSEFVASAGSAALVRRTPPQEPLGSRSPADWAQRLRGR